MLLHGGVVVRRQGQTELTRAAPRRCCIARAGRVNSCCYTEVLDDVVVVVVVAGRGGGERGAGWCSYKTNKGRYCIKLYCMADRSNSCCYREVSDDLRGSRGRVVMLQKEHGGGGGGS